MVPTCMLSSLFLLREPWTRSLPRSSCPSGACHTPAPFSAPQEDNNRLYLTATAPTWLNKLYNHKRYMWPSPLNDGGLGSEGTYERETLDWVVFTHVVRITKVLVSRVLFDQLTCLLPRHSERYLEGEKTHTHIISYHTKQYVYYRSNILDNQLSSFKELWRNIKIATGILFD